MRKKITAFILALCLALIPSGTALAAEDGSVYTKVFSSITPDITYSFDIAWGNAADSKISFTYAFDQSDLTWNPEKLAYEGYDFTEDGTSLIGWHVGNLSKENLSKANLGDSQEISITNKSNVKVEISAELAPPTSLNTALSKVDVDVYNKSDKESGSMVLATPADADKGLSGAFVVKVSGKPANADVAQAVHSKITLTFDGETAKKVTEGSGAEDEITYFTVMGDSISTYTGITNGTDLNNTMGSNSVKYFGTNLGVTSVDQTWWKKVEKASGMTLLLNNSSSGSRVIGQGDVGGAVDQGIGQRSANLHPNLGELAGTKPDVILIYMGTNDIGKGTTLGDIADYDSLKASLLPSASNGQQYGTPNNFVGGYIVFLDKITKNYPDAEIYCMTLPYFSYGGTVPASEKRAGFNAVIRKAAADFGATVIDLAEDLGITSENLSTYYDDGLHPNADGMTLISNVVMGVLEDEE